MVATSTAALSTRTWGRDPTDRQLLDRFIAGRDEAAFAGLVRRYGGIVWSVCRRVLHRSHDAEDAFQAVFVLLARRAATIRNREAVGSWLYGVAYRVAMRAKRAAGRRLDREQRAIPVKSGSSPPTEAAFHELQQILDDEVQRLPKKYRAPFVLCCLEGFSKAEAARELGWKEGTVSGRATRARQLLKLRLARRGVAVSAALTAVAVSQTTASAMPPLLLHATAQAVVGGTSAVSPAAAALANDLLHSVAAAKFKAVLAVALTAAMLGTSAGVGLHGLQPADAPKASPAPAVRAPAPPAPVTVAAADVDEQVAALTFAAAGRHLVTAGAWFRQPGQIKIWDIASGKLLARHRRITGTRCVALSPDGKTLASGQFGGAIKLRDPETGNERTTLKGHTVGVNSLVFSSDGGTLVSAGLDKVVKLWDVRGQREKKAMRGHTDMVHTVAYFHHTDAVVTGGRDLGAIVWDNTTGQPRHMLRGHTAAIETVAVSPDDRYVVTGAWDETIRVWDAETGSEKLVLRGELGNINAVAFSPAGDLLAAAGSGGVIRLWDTTTWTLVGEPARHPAPVWALQFSPDGKTLASGSSDRTARIWDVATLRKGVPAPQEVTPVATFDTAEQPTGGAIGFGPPPVANQAATKAEQGLADFQRAEAVQAQQQSTANGDEPATLKPDGRKKWLPAAVMFVVLISVGLIACRRSANPAGRTWRRVGLIGLPALLVVAGFLAWTHSGNNAPMINSPVGQECIPGVEESGFYKQEYTRDGRPYRWTGGDARLVIPIDRGRPPQAVRVQLWPRRLATVRIIANGHELFAGQFGPRPWEKSFDLTAIDLADRVVLEIVSDTVVPTQHDGGNDSRALGVQVMGITLIGPIEEATKSK